MAKLYMDYKLNFTARSQHVHHARRGQASEVEIQQCKAEHYLS